MDSAIAPADSCSNCDTYFKRSCFTPGVGCNNCFNTMKRLMIELAEALLRAGISLYLDWEDKNAADIIEWFHLNNPRGSNWPEDIVSKINNVLQDRVKETGKVIYMPGSTGDYCLAELQAAHMADGNK